ncbi:TolC family protein [Lacipirellula sp.]|uniref:TolC family protein n=1 Tax=Lacipirellula sp. TaxID=2691419 RepID=UPI003D107FEB
MAAELPVAPEVIDPGMPDRKAPADERSPLIDALSISLAQNPDLIARRQSEGVGVAAVGVAYTYPFNPFVQVQATPYQENKGTTAHYVLLMQRIQLAHQQQYREESAEALLTGIRWNILQAELQTVSTTSQLYFTMLYRRGLRDIANASYENNRLLLDSAEKRLNAGDAAASDVATVRFDADATLQQLQLAETNYQSAIRDLLRQLGMPANATYEFDGDIRKIRWRLPSEVSGTAMHCQPLGIGQSQVLDETWVRGWTSARPDVMAARANVAAARASYRLAAANRVPDVQVGPYYQQTPDGDSHVGFRADMNLPVIDTGVPMQMQRSAELNQQSITWQQLDIRAGLEGLAASERYKQAFLALERDPAKDLFELPAELESLERQFREGEVDVVRAIQARTSMLQNQRARLDLINEAAQSAAILVGATGVPIEQLIEP